MKPYEEWREEFGVLSSTFYRLAKENKKWSGHYSVVDFHKGVNGNCRIERFDHEGLDEIGRRNGGGCRLMTEYVYVPSRGFDRREQGNKKYKELLAEGYFKVGEFESDICGRERRIK